MKTIFASITLLFLLHSSCAAQGDHYKAEHSMYVMLSAKDASHLASLPLKCINKHYPFKPWYVFDDSTYLKPPTKLHPAFCGCYDWHSSVHGHWLLVAILKQFPEIPEADSIRKILRSHLTADNIAVETEIFKGSNLSFERPYGWAWALQLQKELLTWDDPLGKELSGNFAPLAKRISGLYVDFINKLAYPVREPEHYNLAFSLCFAWDYAMVAGDTALQQSVKRTSLKFYGNDKNYPAQYEPGGYDFLSPALEEADLMRRVLPASEYMVWLDKFLPDLIKNPEKVFQPGVVSDPSDAKMVHLYGVNLSRAWCLYNIAYTLPAQKAKPIKDVALAHIAASMPYVVSGRYEGDHWLATYACYAWEHIK